MNNMKYKIGQIIEFKSDHTIKLANGGCVLVKKGDRAQVLKKIDAATGQILYLTGEAAGKSQYTFMQVEETVNEDDIAKMIMKELNN